MPFAISSTFERERRRDHETFYCPAGHKQHFPAKSDLEKLRDQVAAKDEALRNAEHERDMERTRAANIAKKLKATETKTATAAKRTAAGVCTCCNRTFKQLAAHMKNKHPEMLK